jgi:hypothetical protein
MSNLLDSLQGRSKTIFVIAAILLVLNVVGAGINAFTELAIGQTMKDIFQSLGYGTALIGALALYPTLVSRSRRLARIGAALAALGVIGMAVLATAYILNAVGMVAVVPDWVPPMGVGVPLGQLGLALFGIAALRSGAYSLPVGLFLMGPLLVFILFIVGALVVGEAAAPAWVPFLTVSAQALVHGAIALSLPGGSVEAPAAQRQEASLA